jgi:hypothetical protein
MKITRNKLRKLIMEVLEMSQDLGVQNLSDKGVEKGTPIVRGDRGTGGFYKVTGEKIALNKSKEFFDADLIIGLLYRGLLYGLTGTGDDNLSVEDINETKKLNEEYKAYYGTGDSMETKSANVSIISKDLFNRFMPFYRDVITPLKTENKELFEEIFETNDAIKLGKKLIQKGVVSINPETILRNNREYKEKAGKE